MALRRKSPRGQVAARRQQAVDRALRPPMRAPGRPEPSRAVQRAFWRSIADGVTTEDAAAEVGVSTPWGPDGSATLVGCRRSAWPAPPVAICRSAYGTAMDTIIGCTAAVRLTVIRG
jgi:hypothetical protein